ncbi:YetF domain-containing protein, partial [Peribacillus frigoritolerans]|uniref:YetF domain-containing protein n=1 Tax=Peribacillus frigoritolerans TaxID=450367 RepID=UPI0033966438
MKISIDSRCTVFFYFTLVIEEGQIKEEELRSVKKSKEWLREGLQKRNYKKIEDILYGEWSETDGFYIQP